MSNVRFSCKQNQLIITELKYPQIDRLKWWQVCHNGEKTEDRRMREDESQQEKREALARKKNYLPFYFYLFIFYYFQLSPQKLTGFSVTSGGQKKNLPLWLWILKGCKGMTPSDLWHTCRLRRCSGERNWNPQQPHLTNKRGQVVISGSHLRLSCFIDWCKDPEINTPSCLWLPQGRDELNVKRHSRVKVIGNLNEGDSHWYRN